MQEMLLPNQSAHPSLFRLFPAQTADEIHRLLHRLPLCQVPYIHGSFPGQMPSMPEISEVQELHIRSYVHLNNPVTHMPADFRRLRIRLCGKRKNNHSPYNNQRNTDNSPYTFSFHCYPLIYFFFHNRNCFL